MRSFAAFLTSVILMMAVGFGVFVFATLFVNSAVLTYALVALAMIMTRSIVRNALA